MQTNSPKGYVFTLLGLLSLTLSLTNVSVGANGIKGPSNAYFMQPYSFTLQSSFGAPPYTYQLTSGSLPPGLSLSQSGNITGTPTSVGLFPFQVTATDSSQPPRHQVYPYSITVGIGTDQYGGLTALPSPGGASGFFRQEKVAGRWNLVSPLGNIFYMTSVFNATPGFIEPGVMQSRYNNNTILWATHRRRANAGRGDLTPWTSIPRKPDCRWERGVVH